MAWIDLKDRKIILIKPMAGSELEWYAECTGFLPGELDLKDDETFFLLPAEGDWLDALVLSGIYGSRSEAKGAGQRTDGWPPSVSFENNGWHKFHKNNISLTRWVKVLRQEEMIS